MGDEKMKFEVGLNIFKGVADRRGVAVPGSSGGVVSYPAAIQPPDSRNKRASAVYNRAQYSIHRVRRVVLRLRAWGLGTRLLVGQDSLQASLFRP